MSENVGKEQLVREILEAAKRHGVDGSKGLLVATKSCMPQDLLVSGCADLKTGLEGAYSVAVRCDTEVFVYNVGLGELLRLQEAL